MTKIKLSGEEQQDAIDALEQWIDHARDEEDDPEFVDTSARMTTLMGRLNTAEIELSVEELEDINEAIGAWIDNAAGDTEDGYDDYFTPRVERFKALINRLAAL